MKKINLAVACSFLLSFLVACDNSGTSGSKTDSPSTNNDSLNNATNNSATTDNTTNANNTPMNTAPLSKEDSTFVMKAAQGGLMEVESGNVAIQNATNDRVKAFANMMVNDHSKANSELKSLTATRGITLPSALPADKQAHIDGMKKMTGKAFDKHYIDMMLNDHKKKITDFEKQASSGADAELKSWAEKTLPTLKMHRDSVTALSKMKM